MIKYTQDKKNILHTLHRLQPQKAYVRKLCFKDFLRQITLYYSTTSNIITTEQ